MALPIPARSGRFGVRGARRPPVWRKRALRVLLYVAVGLILLWTLAPFLWLFLSSIFPYKELIAPRASHWWPTQPTFANYLALFQRQEQTGELFLFALRNSTVVAGSVTLVCLFFGTLGAYALARLPVSHKNAWVLSLLVIRMLPTIALVIPFFVIVSLIDYRFLGWGLEFHLFDTKLNLVILYTTFIIGFVIWIMRGYFLAVPPDLEEAARIDGCTRMQSLWRVILPLSAPGLVATGILAFLLAWDEFLLALVFTRSTNAMTLPLFIAQLGSQYVTRYDQIATAGVLASLPPVLLAMAFQRFIVSGLTMGSTKG
ncbi:MAG: carbohydrate ABC transporter permease [Firmicutes bacterium]|nr:carbohydrate ABC transporter permease [Bacillota bacterium]